VAAGLAYLHDRSIIHGDIKAVSNGSYSLLSVQLSIKYYQFNILVNDEHKACISDFGLSRILEASGFTTTSVGGTYRWMAYELIAYEFDGLSVPKITKATDTWAFGMTVVEVRPPSITNPLCQLTCI